MQIPLTSSGSEAWANLKLHNPHEVPRKRVDITKIKSHLVCFRGILEFNLTSEIRIKYAKTVPFVNVLKKFILCIDSKIPILFHCKSDLYEESLRATRRSSDSVNSIHLLEKFQVQNEYISLVNSNSFRSNSSRNIHQTRISEGKRRDKENIARLPLDASPYLRPTQKLEINQTPPIHLENVLRFGIFGETNLPEVVPMLKQVMSLYKKDKILNMTWN